MVFKSSESKQKTMQQTLEDELYLAGIIGFVFMVFIGLIFYIFILPKINFPCLFYTITGFYCPGCGGTRAMSAVLKGELLKSVWYHPLVPYSVFMYLAFMVSHTISKVFHGARGMKFRNLYIYLALVIVVFNWIVKNILLHCFGISL